MYGILHIPQEKRIGIGKLEPRSQRCQMIGYDETDIDKFWNETQVIRTKDVMIDERQVW